jgi:hypothetical protein
MLGRTNWTFFVRQHKALAVEAREQLLNGLNASALEHRKIVWLNQERGHARCTRTTDSAGHPRGRGNLLLRSKCQSSQLGGMLPVLISYGPEG